MPRYLTPTTAEWTPAHVRHLLRRAGFGSTPQGAAAYGAMTREAAVEAIIENALSQRPPDVPDDMSPLIEPQELREKYKNLPEEERQQRINEMRRENRLAVKRMETWWMERMLTSPGFLREKMTLFWHGHFATSAEKVQAAMHSFDMYKRLWTNSLGNFHDLTLSVAKAPAMLRYLDNDQNRLGSPNENFARELFELFTLGIGHYTEQDIKEAARALTGWTGRGGQFQFVQRRHDAGRKTVFGESGNFKGEDIIKLVMRHPQMPRWITAKIWRYLVWDEPSPELVEELAEAFVADGLILWKFLRRIFLSEAFNSEKAIRSLIKSPAQFLVGLEMDLLCRPTRPALHNLFMRALGQELFFPPNVKGWEGGRTWINSNTLLARVNIANYFVHGTLPDLGRGPGGLSLNELRRLAREEGVELPPVKQQRPARGKDAPVRRRQGDTLSDDPRDASALGGSPPMMQGQSTMAGMDDDGDDSLPPPTLQLPPPLDLDKLLSTLAFNDAPSLAEALSWRFLDGPLPADHREAILAEAKAAKIRPGQPLTDESTRHGRALVHMLLGLAEYQLA